MIGLLLAILSIIFVIGLIIVLGIIFLALGPIGIILMIIAPFIVIDVLIVKLIKGHYRKKADKPTDTAQ